MMQARRAPLELLYTTALHRGTELGVNIMLCEAPGKFPEYGQNHQVWSPGTYLSMAKTARYGTRVSGTYSSMTKTTSVGSRVPTRVWSKLSTWVPGYLPGVPT